MKKINFSLLFVLALSIPTAASAAGATLRITCEGDDVGAEVTINGKFRGECPVDLKVPAGKLKIRLHKAMDADHEGVFEQDIRMADDSAKRVEAELDVRLNAAAQKAEAKRQRLAEAERLRLAKEAEQRAQAEMRRLAEEKRRAPIQMLITLKQQGIEPGNGKAFRDCPDCPEMVLIPPGSFYMGANSGNATEKPVHRVTIAQAFVLGKTEVTQGQWKAIMGSNPSQFSKCGDGCPVETVSWNDAQEFIRKLNARTGKQYRLPTEAEWEYACRAGEQQEYCGSDDINLVAWYDKNSGAGMFSDGHTHPVAQKQANLFGLYDMSGNVEEWVADIARTSYFGAPVDGSEWYWMGSGMRVLRGGAYHIEPQTNRAARRSAGEPSIQYSNIGFRVARVLP